MAWVHTAFTGLGGMLPGSHTTCTSERSGPYPSTASATRLGEATLWTEQPAGVGSGVETFHGACITSATLHSPGLMVIHTSKGATVSLFLHTSLVPYSGASVPPFGVPMALHPKLE